MESPFFGGSPQNIVAKDVGNGDMQNLPNMGQRFKSLPFQKPKPQLNSLEIHAT
jgi:hypothetical protein